MTLKGLGSVTPVFVVGLDTNGDCIITLMSAKRRRFDDPETWVAQPDRRPLVVRGARQVGKTWLIEAGRGERRGGGRHPQLRAPSGRGTGVRGRLAEQHPANGGSVARRGHRAGAMRPLPRRDSSCPGSARATAVRPRQAARAPRLVAAGSLLDFPPYDRASATAPDCQSAAHCSKVAP